MSQSISLWGAVYSDVPAVDLPKTGGGTARFYDAADGDVMSYGAAPLVGSAVVGSSALCEEEE